jgi:hypothetical protein
LISELEVARQDASQSLSGNKEVRVCWARDVQLRADLISAFPNGSETGVAVPSMKLNTLFLRHLGGKGDNVIMWDSVRM